MTSLVQWVRRNAPSQWPAITLDQLVQSFGQFGYQGLGYGPSLQTTMQQNKEEIQADFVGFINGAYKSNGPVFACVMTRMLLFSEARFQFRRMNNGRPGQLFGTKDLQPVEHPWTNGTTRDLLARMETDVSLAGNWYATIVPDPKIGRRVARLRPDWVTILLGSYNEPDVSGFDPAAELVGYVYHPGGPGSGQKPKIYLPEEVAHYAPIPDPAAHYRGMSWVQPVITELLGDRLMTTHKIMFFENAATPNLVVKMETGKMNRETFREWVDMFESEQAGALNAYRTLYLGQGADAEVVGSRLKDLDYAVVQGHGETRLAAAAGVPPIVVGFSEGLESATYSNFAQARRAFADKTLRPLWGSAAGSLSTIVNVPGGSELWYDDKNISFLQEDAQDEAQVLLTKSTAMRLLVDAGYEPDSIVKAIESNDLSLLKHSGLYSVQLHPPGSDQNGNVNGNGNGGNQGNGNQENLADADGDVILPRVGNVQQLAKALLAARAGE